MTKLEFLTKMKDAIQRVERGVNGYEYVCNILDDVDPKISKDFKLVFGIGQYHNYIPIAFGITLNSCIEDYGSMEHYTEAKLERRLNALTLYVFQSFEYGYYKEL